MTSGALRPVPDGLDAVLQLVREEGTTTRPHIARALGLGRNVVTQRVAQLMEGGLVKEGELASSTGGRAPRGLQFDADAGYVLAAEVGATSITAAVTDLSARIVVQHEEPADVTAGPERVLDRVHAIFDDLRASVGRTSGAWGVGIGVPGPVEFASGRPVAPPIMPGWDGFPVRDVLAELYDAPVWVDNDVNVMALGEHRVGMSRAVQDFLYVKVGTGIGAGLVSGGRLHRGAQGCAGDIGHITVAADSGVVCRCGKIGCLEALAGGAALERQGTAAAEEGSSPYLAKLLASGTAIDAAAVGAAAAHGDPVGTQLLMRSGRLVGETLAALVNFFNPALIVLGGGVVSSGDVYTAAVKEVLFRRSLPLATRDLRINRSELGHRAGIAGAASMVVDELFTPVRLAAWLDAGTPSGLPQLVNLPTR
jgi:glucokinase-like ROK family protein